MINIELVYRCYRRMSIVARGKMGGRLSCVRFDTSLFKNGDDFKQLS